MTVGELIKVLAGYEDDRIVILSADAEGNNYSPLHAACLGIYRPFNTWSGDVLEEDDTSDEGDESCVVLVPVN